MNNQQMIIKKAFIDTFSDLKNKGYIWDDKHERFFQYSKMIDDIMFLVYYDKLNQIVTYYIGTKEDHNFLIEMECSEVSKMLLIFNVVKSFIDMSEDSICKLYL